jgi:hypothetical protein
MLPASDDLEHRRPLWIAMSDLFLDTEIDDIIYVYIARTCHESPYSWAECEIIFWNEVFPACIGNMLIVAGEWVMFDAEWLEERILARVRHWQRRPWKWLLPQNIFSRAEHPYKRVFAGMVKEDWEKVKVQYDALLREQ